MRRFCITFAFIAVGIVGLSTSPYAQQFIVTSASDRGDDTLRQALSLASEGEIDSIVVATESDINIKNGLAYLGSQPISIVGTGQTIFGKSDVTLLTSSGGGDLSITGLSFKGPGGFSINERSDIDGVSGKGIFVDVPDGATGTISLHLTNVTVSQVGNHGIHISDCTLADECGGGQDGSGDGSDASITALLQNVTIDDAGNGKFDADGLRIDERGPGSVHLSVDSSLFTNVGADGVEVDEGQAGSIFATVTSTSFTSNGGYCDPSILDAFMPDADEGEFSDGEASLDDIPSAERGSPDDGCFELEYDLYESGSVEAFEIGIDLDDGIDFDESGSGSVFTSMVGVSITGNLDEGLDFDEAGEGNIFINIIDSVATGNTDDGFKVSEEDDGGIIAIVANSTAMENGGKGFVLEAEDDGALFADFSGVTTSNNDDGDDTGLELVNEGENSGFANVTNSSIADGIDADGVAVTQQ